MMESCPECGSTNLDTNLVGECDACTVRECEDCGYSFAGDEMIGGPEHDCGAII